MLKRVRRNAADGQVVAKRLRSPVKDRSETGSGTPKDPFVLPLRERANKDSCQHCLEESCSCQWVSQELEKCFSSLTLKRQVEQYRKRELCAKSVLPPFVSRLVRIAKITSEDTFFDLGCGNGSVLFQVALLTGARCVGVELNDHNANVAKAAWAKLRTTFESRCGRSLDVEIISGDFCSLLKKSDFLGPSPVIWAANMLLPKPVNHYLSERFRFIPPGSRVLCLEDLYPHSRSVSALRDPDAFERFDMTDFKWQSMSVEWCVMEGPFFMYTRRS